MPLYPVASDKGACPYIANHFFACNIRACPYIRCHPFEGHALISESLTFHHISACPSKMMIHLEEHLEGHALNLIFQWLYSFGSSRFLMINGSIHCNGTLRAQQKKRKSFHFLVRNGSRFSLKNGNKKAFFTVFTILNGLRCGTVGAFQKN